MGPTQDRPGQLLVGLGQKFSDRHAEGLLPKDASPVLTLDHPCTLGEAVANEAGESPTASALVVGIGYMAGALVPVLPVLFGSRSMLPTVVAAGVVIVAVSAVVAFLSGMDVRRRILLNVGVTGIAVVVTYAIGLAAKAVLGVSV